MGFFDVIAETPSKSSPASDKAFLSGLVSALGDSLSRLSAQGPSGGYPKFLSDETPNTLRFRDFNNLFAYLDQQNRPANERLKRALEQILNHETRLSQLQEESATTQNALNGLNHETHNLNHQIQEQNQAINTLNHEIAGLNQEMHDTLSAQEQDQESLSGLELQIKEKKSAIEESLKTLEALKKALQRQKKQKKWKKQFDFLSDRAPPHTQQEHALMAAQQRNGLGALFLADPYAIFPKGFIYEYHNPGKETTNALNAPNPMDGINNQFQDNPLNQVINNRYQKFLPGNAAYHALGSIKTVKALKFHDLVLHFDSPSAKENALFFRQISQYAKGERLKILMLPKKDATPPSKSEEKIEEQEKDLNELMKSFKEAQENALKRKESLKAKENHSETLKNAIHQKERQKNAIEQQKQRLEKEKNAKEQEKQRLERQKNEKEQEKQRLEKEINALAGERIPMHWFLNPLLQVDGSLVASITTKDKSVREYYHNEKRITEILGFYRWSASIEKLSERFSKLNPSEREELTRLLLP
ncbi:UV radiation resistance protein [Helicobacter acinonychis]|uniref:UV radiation resistance protein n=1 Tax=Helicobacter acinonychis TaxID=212 RepID=UPI000CF0F31E|nr:UV radiation resistance protein [Helicobacter acinonychis]